MLALATVTLRMQTELLEVKSMLATRPPQPTPTDTPRKTWISRALGYLRWGRLLWDLGGSVFGTKIGQTVLSFLMPLIMSEAKWRWIASLLRQLWG